MRFKRVFTVLVGGAVAVGLLAVNGGVARAQTGCGQMLEPFVQHAQAGGEVRVTLATNQGNGIVGYLPASTVTLAGGYLTDTHQQDVGLFSDRTEVVGGKVQPFSVEKGDGSELWLSTDGSAAYVFNRVWGNWSTLTELTCKDNIIVGFGPAAGTFNGGLQAVYTFALLKL